jgi:hypothetical protein
VYVSTVFPQPDATVVSAALKTCKPAVASCWRLAATSPAAAVSAGLSQHKQAGCSATEKAGLSSAVAGPARPKNPLCEHVMLAGDRTGCSRTFSDRLSLHPGLPEQRAASSGRTNTGLLQIVKSAWHSWTSAARLTQCACACPAVQLPGDARAVSDVCGPAAHRSSLQLC